MRSPSERPRRRNDGLVLAAALFLAWTAAPTGAAQAEPGFSDPWPAPTLAGTAVALESRSPFALTDVADAPGAAIDGQLFLPPEASAEAPVPAVVLLHGAGGVLSNREPTYAAQLAQQGIAALVVDSFGPRRELGASFVERLLNVTEVMLLADAYAALAWLGARPEIDGGRIAVVGFSYGGMASMLAAYEQVARLFAPDGRRFVAHVAFYPPCIARLADPTTSGAPLLLLSGGGDALVDQARCAEITTDLEQGGSTVERVVYPEALHQWDGGFGSVWRAPRNLAACRYLVDEDGRAVDVALGLPIVNPAARQLSLGLCTTTDGYLLGRDDSIRQQSNRDLAAFLSRVLAERS